jgi:nitrogen fixation protein NifU and related proteins
MKLYNQILMEHYHNPKHYGKLENPDFEVMVFNPLCGDKLYLYVELQGLEISKIGFEGEGCIISFATASIIFDKVIKQTIEAIEMLSEKDIVELIQLKMGPNRLKCALLPLEAIKQLVQKYKLDSSK